MNKHYWSVNSLLPWPILRHATAQNLVATDSQWYLARRQSKGRYHCLWFDTVLDFWYGLLLAYSISTPIKQRHVNFHLHSRRDNECVRVTFTDKLRISANYEDSLSVQYALVITVVLQNPLRLRHLCSDSICVCLPRHTFGATHVWSVEVVNCPKPITTAPSRFHVRTR